MNNKPITTGQLAKALRSVNRSATDEQVRGWADKGLLNRDPLTNKGWDRLERESVKVLLTEHMNLTDSQLRRCLTKLNLLD